MLECSVENAMNEQFSEIRIYVIHPLGHSNI